MLERVRFQSTDQLLDALRERQEQAGIARPKPAAASTEGDDSAVFLTAAAGLVEPTTAMASTVGDDAPQPAHLRVNMERLAAQVAERVKPKQCVFSCDATEQPQDTIYPRAIRGTLTYPLPDEATIRAREEALRNRSAATIQSLFRRLHAEQQTSDRRSRRAAAHRIADSLQRLFRGARCRKLVDRKLRLRRAEALRERLLQEKQLLAVASLTTFFRAFVATAREARLAKAQRRHAGVLDEEEWPDSATLERCALTVQCFWRQRAARQDRRLLLRERHSDAAHTIQVRVREQLANRALKRAEARARDAVETRDADAAVAIQSICRRRQARARVSEIAVASHADEHRSRLDEESLEAATSAARLAAEEAAAALARFSLEPDGADPAPAVGRAPAQPKAGGPRTSEWRP